MADIILVAGTHHGGWYWDSIAAALQDAGHRAFAPTLSGLDDQAHHPGPINLDTHIADVLKVITDNQVEELVLVGHSYAGMVITGVADRTAARIRSLVYLDAALPAPGQSEWDLSGEWLRKRYVSTTTDGINIDVPAEWLEFRSRLMPHPLATKLQPLTFSWAKFDSVPKVYVHAENGFGPDGEHFFERGYRRAQCEPGWQTFSVASGHDLAAEQPEAVVEIILNACAS